MCVRHTTSDANRLRWLEGSRRQAAHLEGFKFAIPRVSQVYSSGMPKAVELVRQAFRAYRPRPLTAPDQAWRRQPRPPDEPFSSSLGAQPLSPSVSSLPRSLALSLSLCVSLFGKEMAVFVEIAASTLKASRWSLEHWSHTSFALQLHDSSFRGGDANVAAAALQPQGRVAAKAPSFWMKQSLTRCYNMLHDSHDPFDPCRSGCSIG